MYAERAYFDGDHCAHVAAWQDDRLRLWRIKDVMAASSDVLLALPDSIR